jgi:hypothetical protein
MLIYLLSLFHLNCVHSDANSLTSNSSASSTSPTDSCTFTSLGYVFFLESVFSILIKLLQEVLFPRNQPIL